jgi:hypothetical protein
MDSATAKQQIVERVKQANKFLVTVNANPTVDQLAACIGLTLMLNKLGKHATAVFSGKVPSTIQFLQPDKTLQKNTDTLRDFIISLDKNKADKLRYKVEDDVVRIFITPYRSSITQKDLIFSDGDFNVEVVLALGVTQRGQLDAAITAHGRILHDATVISVNAGVAGKPPDIGQINWSEPTASSLSEMLVSISEAFGPGLVDSQNATAFLTGIVAETERFSNAKTSPKVMTMSAQLMAAGANQQLIAEKLEPPPPPPPPPLAAPPKPPAPPSQPKQPPLKPEGVIDVPHDDKKTEKTNVELGTTEIHIDEQGNLLTNNNDQAAAEKQYDIDNKVGPDNHHSFLGTTAQPAGLGLPLSSTEEQPAWAAPYEAVSTTPMQHAEFGSSEFGDDPAEADPETIQNNFAQGHEVTPPDVAPVPPPPAVDSARSAVDQAISAAPFDPAFDAPVQALNAQPLDTGPAETQAPPAAPEAPPSPDGTPMLVLPTDGGVSATPPQWSTPPPPDNQAPDIAPAAPPPVPPPLMSAPGAVIPNLPPQPNSYQNS